MNDSNPHHLLGRLNAAWLTLDYILRLALMRAQGISFNTPKSERIFAITGYQILIEKLMAAYSTADHKLLSEFTKILTSPESLHRKYRAYSYALWTLDPASGQDMFNRTGSHNLRIAIPTTPQQIETLITEIQETAYRIETLTKPQN